MQLINTFSVLLVTAATLTQGRHVDRHHHVRQYDYDNETSASPQTISLKATSTIPRSSGVVAAGTASPVPAIPSSSGVAPIGTGLRTPATPDSSGVAPIGTAYTAPAAPKSSGVAPLGTSLPASAMSNSSRVAPVGTGSPTPSYGRAGTGSSSAVAREITTKVSNATLTRTLGSGASTTVVVTTVQTTETLTRTHVSTFPRWSLSQLSANFLRNHRQSSPPSLLPLALALALALPLARLRPPPLPPPQSQAQAPTLAPVPPTPSFKPRHRQHLLQSSQPPRSSSRPRKPTPLP